VEVDERRVRPGGSEVDRLLADSGRALSVLGWKPAVSLEQGLERTIDWVRGNLEKFRAGEYVL
jgi:nucleoside-diphosphate-sugar epimerase